MVAAFFSSILELLEIIVAEEAKQGRRLVGAVGEDVKVLRKELNAIIISVLDVEKKILTDRDGDTVNRINKLTDAAYDLVDVLDEWITTLQINGVGKTSNLKAKAGSYVTHSLHTAQDVRRYDLDSKKLKETIGRLKATAKREDISKLAASSRCVTQHSRRLESSSFVDVTAFIGRDEVKGDIVRSLLYGSTEEESDLLKTISVVGMGGVGKTAIAQLVYHDEAVKQHFRKRIWVCVSNAFEEVEVAKAITAGVEHVAVDSLDSIPLDTLHERIRRSIKGKKFFLVLDDVWADNMQRWKGLIETFKHGAPGSRILLTTRKDTVANMMKGSRVFHLEVLSDEHCWMVLRQSAFHGRGVEECRNLEDIGKRISKKCKGLPLAAKTLGCLLTAKFSIRGWEDILNSEIWELKTAGKEIFADLLLSYKDLPLPLGECFKYCAIFPKDFVYDGETIIYHWMAQGYLGWDNGEDLELKGREYIGYLAARSFFQDFLMDRDGLKSTWKMHDIMHDFARYLMINDGIVIEVNPAGNSKIDLSSRKARYVTAFIPEGCCLPTSINSAGNLHSLVIISGENAITNEAVQIIFNQAKRLRLVDFGCHNALMDTIPKEIGNLIHMRHINLSGSKIKGLPRSLCQLHNLQYLNLHNCESLENLPDEIGNLIHLRHINLSGSKIKELPRSLCELLNLQYLNLDNCEALENLPDEIGNLIHLTHINLSGRKIKGLLRSLCQLHNLQYLNLHNCESLENLPNEIGNLIHLRHINLSGSKIKRLPGSLCQLHNLQYLNLDNCEALENLPEEIGKLINLTYLGTLHCCRLACYPKSARTLTNLRQLHGIVLRADRNDPKEFALGDLENLNHLRELSMVLKGNAVNDRELKRAKFENKAHLKEIKVE